MKPTTKRTLVSAAALTLVASAMARAVTGPAQASSLTPATHAPAERGAYLVRAMGCNDCHTPWKVGPGGPEPDMSRALTGHPAELVMPPPSQLKAPWTWSAAGTNTAFAGPWGVSFTANLTPDPETGLGRWTADMFIATMKTGRHEGKGRPLLPPMPFRMIASLTDDDIRSVFAYLQSLPPVRNRVPAPIDPPEGQR
jgi:cytochrome c553